MTLTLANQTMNVPHLALALELEVNQMELDPTAILWGNILSASRTKMLASLQ
jgi:hypothetical protein